jgi:SulP family sulfate permease
MAMLFMLMLLGLAIIKSDQNITDSNELLVLAIIMTFMTGVIQLGMGVFRLGGLVNLLSYPVVTGFTTAAAFHIGASQIKALVGFKVEGALPHEKILYVFDHVDKIEQASFIVGVSSIIILVLLKKFIPKAPKAIIVVLLGIGVSASYDFLGLGVATVGDIREGLPDFGIPKGLSWDTLMLVASTSLTIALIAFMESISAAKVYARQNNYAVSPSQELTALGLSNIGSAFSSGCVVGGALSRTAVNAQAGAKTPLANVITSIIICLTLLFLTKPFEYLPKPVLAAIIMVAVVSLIDIAEMKHLWKIKRDDLALCLITFISTLMIGISEGILIGVFGSLLWLVFTTTRPEIAKLGRLPETTSYRSVEHFPEAETFDRIVIICMDAQFFFGNVSHLKDSVMEQFPQTKDAVALVIDASSMNALDSTAADAFSQVINELRDQRVEVMVSHVKGSVLRVMERAGLIELLGEGHIFYEVHDAVQAAIRHREAIDQGVSAEEEDFGPSDYVD